MQRSSACPPLRSAACGTEHGAQGTSFLCPWSLCRYVIAIADSLGDGEVEQEEMTQAVATWKALLNDQDTIACELASPHLVSRMWTRRLALTRCPCIATARFDIYDTDNTGTLDKPQVAEVLKVPSPTDPLPRHEAAPSGELHTRTDHNLHDRVLRFATQDLNGGNAVPDEETQWVIESADGKGPLKLADGVLNKEVRRCCRWPNCTAPRPRRATPTSTALFEFSST